jgi:hypothetical protein
MSHLHWCRMGDSAVVGPHGVYANHNGCAHLLYCATVLTETIETRWQGVAPHCLPLAAGSTAGIQFRDGISESALR